MVELRDNLSAQPASGVTVGSTTRGLATGAVSSTSNSSGFLPTVSTTVAGGNAGTLALQQKVRKVLKLRPEQTRDELKYLSNFLLENNAQSRRNMRTCLEIQQLKVHEKFITEFSEIESQLLDLNSQIESLGDVCDKIITDLESSQAKTKSVRDEASKLREKRTLASEKKKICEAFLGKFRLAEEDLDRIRSADHPIDNKFFQALEKVEEIRRNCKMMAGGAGGSVINNDNMSDNSSIATGGPLTVASLLNASSAYDVLQETNEILEGAFERLFISVQQQCRRLGMQNDMNFLKMPGVYLKRSLQCLKERPIYFNHCLRDIAKMRKSGLSSRFHDALCKSDGINGRPIEINKSYDPVKYVGDMLAWIHENTATEKEALITFLGMSIKKERRSSRIVVSSEVGSEVGSSATTTRITTTKIDDSQVGSQVSGSTTRLDFLSTNYGEVICTDDDLRADLTSILDFVVEGLLDPFKTRIEELLELNRVGNSNNGSNISSSTGGFTFSSSSTGGFTTMSSYNNLLIHYKIAELFSYFGKILRELLHKNNAFAVLITDLHTRVYRKFLDLCEQKTEYLMINQMNKHNTIINRNVVGEDLMNLIIYGEDLSAPSFVLETVRLIEQILPDLNVREKVDEILSAAYDPVLNFCRHLTNIGSPADRAVFLINCLTSMSEPILDCELAQVRVQLYKSLIEEQLELLVAEQTRETLEKLGLYEKIEAVRKLEKGPDGRIPTKILHASNELHGVALSSVLRTFYTSLFTLQMATPHVERICNKPVRNATRKKINSKLAESYEELYIGIQDLQIATHTPKDVRVLLES